MEISEQDLGLTSALSMAEHLTDEQISGFQDHRSTNIVYKIKIKAFSLFIACSKIAKSPNIQIFAAKMFRDLSRGDGERTLITKELFTMLRSITLLEQNCYVKIFSETNIDTKNT